MTKLKKEIDTKIVKSINKNVRSSTRKLNPILKSIVGKKVDVAIRDLSFSDKNLSTVDFITPSSLMRKVVLKTPSYSFPLNFFFPHTPKALISSFESSAKRLYLNPYLPANLFCLSTVSGLTPIIS